MPEGARIYNLFPLLAGTIEQWHAHLERIAGMGFNWIFLNPIHYAGLLRQPLRGQGLTTRSTRCCAAAPSDDAGRAAGGFRQGGRRPRCSRHDGPGGQPHRQGLGAGAAASGLVRARAGRLACFALRRRSAAPATTHGLGRSGRNRLSRPAASARRSSPISPRSSATTSSSACAASAATPPTRCRTTYWRALIDAGQQRPIPTSCSSPRTSARCWSRWRFAAPASTTCSTAPSGGTSARLGCSTSTSSSARSRRRSPFRKRTTPTA